MAFAQAGYDVAISDIVATDQTRAILRPVSDRVVDIAADITDEDSIEQLFRSCIDAFGAIDVVVHCAGVLAHEPLLTTDLSDFERIIKVNLSGTFLVGREALRNMHEQQRGRLIVVASDLSHIGREQFSAYCASKAAVLSLARTWALEFAPDILVNAICPGPIDTPMLGESSMSKEWRDKESDIPLGRLGEPGDVARMAVYLAGPGGDFITGQGIGVNGGSVM